MMSGIGGFRGVSAVQDSRFSNKQAKLMKEMKFPKELDLKIDMKKVQWPPISAWIAKRITELLGIEEEVLIGMVHNYFNEGKGDVDPKVLHMDLVPFLEKNTSLFMKELWSLLHSASTTESGIPQPFLDAKMQEMQQKKEQEAAIQANLAKKREEQAKRQEEEREAARARGEADGADRPPRSAAGPRDSDKESRERDKGGRERGVEHHDDRDRQRYGGPPRERDPYPRGDGGGARERGGYRDYDRRPGDYERDYRDRGRGEGYERRPERREYVGAKYRERDQRRSRSRSPPGAERVVDRHPPAPRQEAAEPLDRTTTAAEESRPKRARPEGPEHKEASPMAPAGEEGTDRSARRQRKEEAAPTHEVVEPKLEVQSVVPEVPKLDAQESAHSHHVEDRAHDKEAVKVKKEKKEKKMKKEKKQKKEKKHKKSKDRGGGSESPDEHEEADADKTANAALDEIEVLRQKAREALKRRPSE